MSDLFFGQIGGLRKPLIASVFILMSSGMAIAEFQRPAIDGAIPDAVKAACTAEKSPAVKSIQDRGVLNWALGISPPFGFRESDGQYGGIEVDNALEFAHFLGVKANIADYDYNLLPTALTSGQADIIGAQLFKTEARAKVIDFSNTYFLAGQLFFVLRESKWQTIAELNSKENRFVHMVGAAQVDMAKELIPNAELVLVQPRGQLVPGYDFMKAGQGDSTAMEAHIYGVVQSNYPDIVAIGANGRVSQPPATKEDMVRPYEIAFGIPKNDQGFKDCIDAYVEDLLSTGRLQQRIDFWTDKFSRTNQ